MIKLILLIVLILGILFIVNIVPGNQYDQCYSFMEYEGTVASGGCCCGVEDKKYRSNHCTGCPYFVMTNCKEEKEKEDGR